MHKLLAIFAVLAVTACAAALYGTPGAICENRGEVMGTPGFDACVRDAAARMPPPPPLPQRTTPAPGATGCMLTGEQVSGFNKICTYDCMGSARAVTIASTGLCALTL